MQKPKTLDEAWELIQELLRVIEQLRKENDEPQAARGAPRAPAQNQQQLQATEHRPKGKPASGELKGGPPKGHKGYFRAVAARS